MAAIAFLPIAELSAYQRNWTIKARVTNKALLRTFKKGAGEGKVFHVELLDAMGGEIRASFFNQGADKFHEMLEKGKCFIFKGGSVKVANKQYNNLNHRYELTFDKEAVVEAAQDDASIDTIRFSFLHLKAIGARSLPTIVDLCGVITSFKPTQTVTTKEGIELTKREITVADDTATCMTVTLWGDRAKQGDSVFEGSPTVALKGVSVKEWRDSRSGSLSQGGELMLNPDMPEAAKAQQWWSHGGSSQELVKLSEAGPNSAGGAGRNATPTTLAGIRLASERLGSQPETFSVVARLALIQTRKQGEVQPLHYMACMEPREGSNLTCNKRVDEEGVCPIHGRVGKVEPRLNMRCRFVDFEDAAWLTSFHEAASKIIGMSGEEVRALEQTAAEKGEAGREELDAMIRKRYFDTPMQLTIRAKMDNYNGEPRANVSIIDARPVSRVEHGRLMLKELKQLLAQPDMSLGGA
jgi:replication factor A1